jgi:hypothetical protein
LWPSGPASWAGRVMGLAAASIFAVLAVAFAVGRGEDVAIGDRLLGAIFCIFPVVLLVKAQRRGVFVTEGALIIRGLLRTERLAWAAIAAVDCVPRTQANLPRYTAILPNPELLVRSNVTVVRLRLISGAERVLSGVNSWGSPWFGPRPEVIVEKLEALRRANTR